ncbi:MAG: DUF885 family protein [Kofleriaceae bacterium]
MKWRSSLVALCVACGGVQRVAPVEPTPRLSELPIPGDPAFVTTARDVIAIAIANDPSVAASAGLFDDATGVPSFSPAAISERTARLDRDLAALRAMPWRTWPIDQQIDFRWVFANAETAQRQLVVERVFEHRPAAWLEPLANQLIAFASYVPGDPRPRQIWAKVPALVDDMHTVATAVTSRDRETARKLITALVAMAKVDGSAEASAAIGSLERYDRELAALHPTREMTVVGADNYAWRLAHAELLDQSPAQLLATARSELARVAIERGALKSQLPDPPAPTAAQRERATDLTRDSLLEMYDAIEAELRAATIKAGFVTIPASVGPIHARETPDAMVPLGGDGGSMNPPPPYIASNVGAWNVEHFHAGWDDNQRLEKIIGADGWKTNGFGPYAAHEGFPGHHLQLAIARLNPDPIRRILVDGMQNEGWGLYAEEELWRHGGLGDAPATKDAVLRSYQFRIMRVIYDVNIETGVWTLQQAADFQQQTPPGKGEINEDLLRAIQWPTQLVHYFAGKQQILALRAEYQKKLGAAYTDRAFHDAFLAEGSIPVPLIRAKLLGTPVPEL